MKTTRWSLAQSLRRNAGLRFGARLPNDEIGACKNGRAHQKGKAKDGAPRDVIDQQAAGDGRDHGPKRVETSSGMRWRAQACRGIGVARNRARQRAATPAPNACKSRPRMSVVTPCANAQARLPRRNTTRPASRTGRRPNLSDMEPQNRVENAMARGPARRSTAPASRRGRARPSRRNHRQINVDRSGPIRDIEASASAKAGPGWRDIATCGLAWAAFAARVSSRQALRRKRSRSHCETKP